MVQPRHRTRLELEAREGLGRAGGLLGQNLDRDVATQSRIPRAVDLPHAALSDRLEQLVGAQAGA
jgi:hypothetical protein